MRLDIYKRPENGGQFSYLAVPEGSQIPEEATNLEWEAAQRSIDFDEDEDKLTEYLIEEPLEQISSKGYAITSVKKLIEISHEL